MPRARRRLPAALAGVVAVLLSLLVVPPAAVAGSSVGAPGVGDPYFPTAGNGGVDVRRYDLRLEYTPPRSSKRLVGHLRGDARIDLRATQALTRFDLDLRGLAVSAVTVDGRAARFSQAGGELRIRPATALRAGQDVRVRVVYAGSTGRPTDTDGAVYGWVTTADGAVVANEPDGAPTWFPANDHPTDKASYRISVRVPKGKVAVANGLLVSHRTVGTRTTWVWSAPEPMASYLATATVGDFRLTRSTAAGVPLLDAVDRDLPSSADDALRRTGEMVELFAAHFGPYPFAGYGAIIDDDELGYALETQTRSLFTGAPDEVTVAHELAYQWFGDDVSPQRWSDVWLNEGWATYAEWMWQEHRGGRTPQQEYAAVLARPAGDDFWRTVVADPGRSGLFSAPVYQRGGAALHALRLRIGDTAFFALARAWVDQHSGGSASTADFEALAEQVSGQQLDDLFDAWVHSSRKPA